MKTVVITGAAGGIGVALTQAFTDAGYRVLATDCVHAPSGLACSDYLRCDLRRTVEEPAYAEEMFGRIRQLLQGDLAALINNAAVQVLGTAGELSREDWRATLDVNLLAPFLWAQALLPELEAAHGMVLNISSIHARLTKPGFIAYATSKAALSGMTRAMAVELGSRVRVNAIEPAAIDTPMLRAGFEDHPRGLTRLDGCHPTGRIGSVDEVGKLALLLVDGRIPFLNAACIPLDGGIGGALLDPDAFRE